MSSVWQRLLTNFSLSQEPKEASGRRAVGDDPCLLGKAREFLAPLDDRTGARSRATKGCFNVTFQL